jgi:hypothetical protein
MALDTKAWKYEGRLKSSWTRLIIPSRNFTEVRWRPFFFFRKYPIATHSPAVDNDKPFQGQLRSIIQQQAMKTYGQAQV